MYRWQVGQGAPTKKFPCWLQAALSLVYVTLWGSMIYAATEKSLRGESSGDWPVVVLVLVWIGVGLWWRWRSVKNRRDAKV